MTSFSSWGPTDDGRIKPDLMAPGCQTTGDFGVTSTTVGGTYEVKCGTSMAAPVVTGVVALMRQRWGQALPSPDLLPSTIKGILINTATDLGAVVRISRMAGGLSTPPRRSERPEWGGRHMSNPNQ